MTDQAASIENKLEELLQFVYLMPVGVVKFDAEGTVDLINPVALQILLPLDPQGELHNLFDALVPTIAEARVMIP